MKRRILSGVALLMIVVSAGCTQQCRARNFGGDAQVDLEPGRKLVQVAWKEDSLWYLTRAMTASDIAETYDFRESSSFGVMEGKVTIRERLK